MFSESEISYIRSQYLARIATVNSDGQPDVVPVGYEFDGSVFYIGGRFCRRHANSRIFWRGAAASRW